MLEHFNEQHAGGHVADAWDGGHNVKTFGPGEVRRDQGCNGCVDLGELRLNDGQPRFRLAADQADRRCVHAVPCGGPTFCVT